LISATNIHCLNEQGKRSNNEDFISPLKGRAVASERLFVVCDGVGGENKGEVASEIVCTSIRDFYEHHGQQVKDRAFVLEAIAYANQQLAGYALHDPAAKRMSTTLSMVVINPESVLVAWCGDSRVHHIRAGAVLWMSNDHSLVRELVRSGELSEHEAATHPQRNIITRSLNAGNRNNQVDFHEIKNVEEGDYVLLCTDGFLEQVNHVSITQVLSDNRIKDKGAAFFSICDGRTRDNFSMYLIQLTTRQPVNKQPQVIKAFLVFVLFLIIGLLLFSLM
jgi:protein phosphatase